MAQVATTRRLNRELTSPLARLRLYIRGYVLLHGLALVAVSLAAAFWATLALDWLFEPLPAVRLAMLVLAVLAVGSVLVRYLMLRLAVPLEDGSLALLLERRYRHLGDRLLTVVQLADREPESAGFDPRMLSHTEAEVRGLLPGVQPRKVLNSRPLLVASLVAGVAAASVALLILAQPATYELWVARTMLLGPQRWPRDTSIQVEGFARDANHCRTTKVAIGGDLDVRALADTALRIPDALEVRYVSAEGAALRQNMTAQGTAVPGRDRHQHYLFKFKNIQDAIRFDVVARGSGIFGKDDRVDDLWIEAVESPTLVNLVLDYEYPRYLGWSAQSKPVTGIMAVLDGTQVRIAAEASKPLVRVECQIAAGQGPTVTRVVEVSGGGTRFELPLGTVRSNTVVLFTLYDTDGVSNRQPARLQLRHEPDDVPEVDVRLAGIGKAITPAARLPVRGRIRDDHGVTRTWFEYRIKDEKQARQQSLALPADGLLTKTTNVALDAKDLELPPGGRIHLWVKAADAFPLDKSPHVGSTPRFELEIVTESQLRALMETAELLLRRRLEGVIADLNRARDSLARLKSDGATAGPPAAPPAAAPAGADRAAAAEESATPAQRALARNAIRVEAALQSCQRNAHETLEVAEQFDRILEELENNRVEHLDQLRSRLQDGIAAPLKRVVADDFPRLRTRLETLRGALADDSRRVPASAAAQQQLDTILRQMDLVLGKMLELENYNELLAQLRNIIQSHEKITRLTRERREQLKKELRKGLLE